MTVRAGYKIIVMKVTNSSRHVLVNDRAVLIVPVLLAKLRGAKKNHTASPEGTI